MLVVFASITALGLLGFRINLTPSEPLGLWRILPLDRSVRTGDLIFICPPLTEAIRKARSRGYLRYGLCAGGLAPLIKTVVALPGQVIDIEGEVRIDGEVLPHSRLFSKDGKWRTMIAYPGGVVPLGTVFLHSAFAGSFDSRYFGPMPADNILGLAREVWTYAP